MGLTLVITQGYPIRPLGETFQIFGKGELFGVPELFRRSRRTAQRRLQAARR